MQYDPIKDVLNSLVKRNRLLRKLFYVCLDLFILRQWYIKSAIRRYLNGKGELVFYDAGAGFCQYSDFVLCKYKKSKVVAVDLKADYLTAYYSSLSEKDKRRFSFLEGDLTKYKLKEQKADCVIAIDILEHIGDDVSVLKNFYSSMHESGYLIISTPSNFDDSAAFTEEHVRAGYSMDELREKVTLAGFEIVESKYSYGLFGRLYWLLIMKNSLVMVKFSRVMFFFLPLYLLLVFVPAVVLMLLDFVSNNKNGNGIVLVAKKNSSLNYSMPAV